MKKYSIINIRSDSYRINTQVRKHSIDHNSLNYLYAKKIFDLEDRLVDFSCRVIDVVEALPSSGAGNYIAGQLISYDHLKTITVY